MLYEVITIKKLLHDEGYTIAGAKKKLEGELKSGVFEASLGEDEEATEAATATPEVEATAPSATGSA